VLACDFFLAVTAPFRMRELMPALARCADIGSGAAQDGAQPVTFDGSIVVTKTPN
jgi:hypothetical protein